MIARYIVRLDDACPTMRRESWDRLECIFDQLCVRPLVAVIPDNRDPSLAYDRSDEGFWTRVRRWQARGWTIGMHGLHHLYHRVDPQTMFLPFHPRSEFAGLPFDAQANKLEQSWRIFEEEGVVPSVWIAPGHAFDRTTLAALAATTPIRVISDGLATRPFMQDGFTWVPQQLWSFRARRSGTWTVCLHPNSATNHDLIAITEALKRYRDQIVGLPEVIGDAQPRSSADRMYHLSCRAKTAIVETVMPTLSRARRLIFPGQRGRGD